MRTRATETRRRLLEEGAQALGGHGYHGTGLKEILDRVGVPKGSFYNYFESKEQFTAEVIRYFAQQSNERMDAWLAGDVGDARAALRGYFDDAAARWQQDSPMGCLLGNLGAELGCTKGLCREALMEGMSGMHARFEKVLAGGQQRGQVRDDVTASQLADLVLCAYEGALLRARIVGTVEPIRGLSHFLADVLVAPATMRASGKTD